MLLLLLLLLLFLLSYKRKINLERKYFCESGSVETPQINQATSKPPLNHPKPLSEHPEYVFVIVSIIEVEI